MRIEDKKGQEQVYLRSEKDLDVYVRNDWKEWVGNEQHTTVGANLNQQVAADQHITIKQNHKHKVAKTLSQHVGQAAQIKISGSHVEQAGQDIVLKAGMSLVIQAGVELTLKAGGGLLKLDPSGVTVKGPMVRINSGGAATPGKPAVIASPQQPQAADQGDKPGQPSAPALPNTPPLAQAEVSTQSVLGGNVNADTSPRRTAVSSRETDSADMLSAAMVAAEKRPKNNSTHVAEEPVITRIIKLELSLLGAHFARHNALFDGMEVTLNADGQSFPAVIKKGCLSAEVPVTASSFEVVFEADQGLTYINANPS